MSNNAVKEPERSERRAAGKCLYCPPGPGARDACEVRGRTGTHCWAHLILNATSPSKLRGKQENEVRVLLVDRERAKASLAGKANSKDGKQAQPSEAVPPPSQDESAEEVSLPELIVIPDDELKHLLIEKFGPVCVGCGLRPQPLPNGEFRGDDLELDHIEAKKRPNGIPGSDSPFNRVPLCHGCNRKKGHTKDLYELRRANATAKPILLRVPFGELPDLHAYEHYTVWLHEQRAAAKAVEDIKASIRPFVN